MLDQVFLTVNSWMTSGTWIAALGCFVWGMISVMLSPCHMASIPLLIAYVAGQKIIPPPRQAARFAVLFASGLFITIIAIGLICSSAGRMLGDVGPWWQIAVGILLLWVAWTLFRPPQCSATGNILGRFQIQGAKGALFLGLAYGTLSGACTFGFIAPILGIITLQEKVLTGVILLVLFGLGHCLPLVFCGIFSARSMELLHSHAGQKMVTGMRKVAAGIIACLGVYFSAAPFWN